MGARRVNVLGVGISAINLQQARASVEAWIVGHEHQYVCVAPAHSVMECYRQPLLRRVFNLSGLTTPDGMAIVWLLKLHGEREASRVYGPDLMQSICAASTDKGWRHFLYGGNVGVAECLKENLEAKYHGIQIVGLYAPPFRQLTEEEDRDVIRRINDARPDVVWVGLSSPKQEIWMSEHLGKLNASVMVGVGAAFDFLSGLKPQAPRWMQRSGLEWLFRWATEPRRLWPRYSQYPLFVMLVLAQLSGLRKFPLVA